MDTRTLARSFLAMIVVLSVATLAQGYLTYSQESKKLTPTQTEALEPREGYTVVTTSERTEDGDRDNAIVVYHRTGSVAYYNDSHRVYNDVDSVPGKKDSLVYVASDRVDKQECDATTDCWLNQVEVLNLSTGETRTVYSRFTSLGRGQWHDVDLLGDHRLLVADIALDRAFVVNTATGVVEWEWQAQSAFPMDGGGLFPGDWTHINDVSLLPDGRIMLSLRNQDQVVFVDRQSGIQREWTLGADDDHETLYEQHNPDYIPAERGGPALLVSDSENNRIVEYHRTSDGKWREAWTWEDPQLMWPRDADRLPNGNTLITDSNGGRVLEINPNGEIVWSVTIDGAYDAERLGTGIESAGGHTADAGYASSTTGKKSPRDQVGQPNQDDKGAVDRMLLWVKGLLPRLVVNGVLYVLPPWVGFVEFSVLVLLGAIGFVWPLAELHWAGWSIQVERDRPT